MNSSTPPKLLLRFLRWFCHPSLHRYIEGDLLELYEARVKTSGISRANVKLFIDVLLLFRPSIIRPMGGYGQLNNYGMLKSYFKVGVRNILKHKTFSFINIFGLAVGIAASLMLYKYTYFQKSYDDFHTDAEQLYRVNLITSKEGSELGKDARTPPAVGSTLATGLSEIETYSRVVILGEAFLNYEEKNVREKNVLLVDPQHFELFHYDIVHGVPEVDLNDPMMVFISTKLAKKMFGSIDPVDKSIRINSNNFDGNQDFVIKGVFKSQPSNAHLRPDILISYATLHHFVGKEIDSSWDFNNLYTYVKLAKGVDPAKLRNKITPVLAKHHPNEDHKLDLQLILQSVTRYSP